MTVRLPVRPSTPQGNRCEKSYFIAGGASCSMKQSRTQSLLAFGTTRQHQGNSGDINLSDFLDWQFLSKWKLSIR